MIIKAIRNILIADKHPWRPHWRLSDGEIKDVPDYIGERLISIGHAEKNVKTDETDIETGKDTGEIEIEIDENKLTDGKSEKKLKSSKKELKINKKSEISKIPLSLKNKIG